MRLRYFCLGLLLVAVLLAPYPASPVHAQTGGTTTTHTVQAGENLFRIALRYGTTVQALATANNIANPALIYVGQVLVIPAAGQPVPQPTAVPGQPTPVPGTLVTYTVVAGDNLSRIAQRYGTTVAALASANNIVNPNLIYVGQVLKITSTTGGQPVPQPTAAPGQPTAAPVPTSAPTPTGSFELGGQVQDFSRPDLMRQARMTWVKKQVRYNLGDDPNAQAGMINNVRGQGFRILLSVVGDKGQLGSGGAGYMDQFAGYLAGLARLGPDAIEVWNEMNLDREWPNGQISPTMYTQMLSKAYGQIKGANPSVMVISGAPSPTGAEGAFGQAAVWNDDRVHRGHGGGWRGELHGLHRRSLQRRHRLTRPDQRRPTQSQQLLHPLLLGHGQHLLERVWRLSPVVLHRIGLPVARRSRQPARRI